MAAKAKKDKPPKAERPERPKGGTQPPPDADRPPKRQASGAAKRRKRLAADIERIEQGFAQLLVAPAGIAGAFGDSWAVDHFSKTGPELAKQLAAECERNEQLRRWALKLIDGQSMMMLAMASGMYLVPPLMHYGLVPGGEDLGIPVVRMPSRRRRREATEPPPQAAAANGQAPFIRHPDGRITHRDGSPLSAEEEAILAGEPPEPEAEPEPPIAPL